MSWFDNCVLEHHKPRSQAAFSLRERNGEKEVWDTLYVACPQR